MNSSWTVKIAGVHGIGKTTIMSALASNTNLDCMAITYSTLLKEFGGSQELADKRLAEILTKASGLVLMDEHLEFDNPNKARNYIRENTRGLVLLDSPLKDLLVRIDRDGTRLRNCDHIELSRDLEASRVKALELERELQIPLLVVPNLEGSLDRGVAMIASFLQSIKP